MTTAESNISTNTANISTNSGAIASNTIEINNIKNQLSTIPINPYEGLFYSVYTAGNNRAAINYNFNIGGIIYWWNNNANAYITAINNIEPNFE